MALVIDYICGKLKEETKKPMAAYIGTAESVAVASLEKKDILF